MSISKALLLDENDKPMTPSGGSTADLTASVNDAESVTDWDAWAAAAPGRQVVHSDDPVVIAKSTTWLRASDRERIQQRAHELWPQGEWPGVAVAHSSRTEATAEAALADAMSASLAKTAGTGGTIRIRQSEFIGECLAWMDAEHRQIITQLAPTPKFADQPSAAPSSGANLLDLLEVVDKLAPVRELRKVADKLEELIGRPQAPTVKLDEASVRAIAAAIRGGGGFEVLAKDGHGRMTLARGRDGVVMRYAYDADGALESAQPVENPELALAQTKIATAKAAAKAKGLRELATADDPALAASARRVLAAKGSL